MAFVFEYHFSIIRHHYSHYTLRTLKTIVCMTSLIDAISERKACCLIHRFALRILNTTVCICCYRVSTFSYIRT